ncbi:acetyl-CoA C-acetyltransferase [Effusibacillus lacus]|uniref:acetyl-CoA C-acyltransferase n=1 Tax=Effusibacillus lacus TaxID=1348429 RepID=A0A292YJ89_9BACL|nr:acetyl-CoA C-acetyltransferase [Effusibacillus lacus]TCS68580.1 acetyl-CoA acyltransferase [Effusibacillus lacus]GAX88833.1 acetyl-CoA acetyltransferase [Effusibacillus lacus]
MKEAVIVAGVRTAVGKAPKGSLRQVRPEDLGGIVIEELVRRTPGLDPAEIEDVIIGCAMPEGEQGTNLARIVAQRAGLPNEVSGMTVNRFCSSGLQTIALAAQQIMIGQAEVLIAGGVESMSHVPMTGYKLSPNPWLAEHKPEIYISMGHTAERVAQRFNVTREDQDAFAVRSHQRAAAAIKDGKFKDEIVPVKVQNKSFEDGKVKVQEFTFDTDEGVRPETTMEILAKLRPAFHVKGSVTAGNSSQTSDGAAAVMVMSADKAASLGLKPLAVFRSFAVGGVDPDIMGVGPVVAIPKALKMAGISKDDVDLFEINEAFASQAVYVTRHLELDMEKVNVNGGAIALGHPLGCTGSKLTVQLLNELRRRNGKYGVVSMCIGGGMGAAGVFELV